MGNNKDDGSDNIHKKYDKSKSVPPLQTPAFTTTPTKNKEGLAVPPKYDKKNPVSRTKEERKDEARIIINKLTELELTVAYEPIKKLFGILQKYINDGGKITINIPFPMIEKRIKGLLPDTVNEKCWIKLVHE